MSGDRLRARAAGLCLCVIALIGGLLLAGGWRALAHALGSPLFVDVTDAAGVSYLGDTFGLAWGDYDRDGHLDLFAGNHLETPALYHNNGDGTFTDVLDGSGIGPQGDRKDSVWVDYDDDGDLDLYIVQGLVDEGPNQLYQNDGLGHFVDVAEAAGVTDTLARGRGAAWADYDNDGDLDLFVANARYENAPNTLFRNNGDGTFADVGDEVDLTLATGSVGAAWADYDADGDPDLYVSGTFNRLYRNDGDVFHNVTLIAGVFAEDGTAPTWADYDNDGDLDLYVSSGTGMGIEDYQISTSNLITFVGSVGSDGDEDGLDFATPAGAGVTFHLQEFKKDAIQDASIIFLGPDGHHPADNPFTLGGDQISGPPAYTPAQDEGFFIWQSAPGDWHIRWSAPPLAIENVYFSGLITATSPILSVTEVSFEDSAVPPLPDHLFRNEGDGTFTDVTAAAGVACELDSRGAAWGDYDNDGDLDLFLVMAGGVQGNEPDRLYRNNGDGTFTDVAAVEGVTGSGGGRGWAAMWADYDNDGSLDLYVQHRGMVWPIPPGGHQLFHNQGNGNHWLKLQLIGDVSNHDSLGAKVWVTAGGRTQFREVRDESPHFAHYGGPLHVGLGGSPVADQVRIEWPSGATRELIGVPADQLLTVLESGQLRLAKSVDPTVVSPGDRLYYTIAITNLETYAATNVWFTDTLPALQRAVSIDTTQGHCTSGWGWGDDVICDLGTMAPGGSVRVDLTARVVTTPLADLPQKMHNVAQVTATGTTGSDAYADSVLQDCHVRLNDASDEYDTVQAAVDVSTEASDVVKVAGACVGVEVRAGMTQTVYVDKTVTIQGGYRTDDWHHLDPVANPTTLDALGQGRVFYVTGDVSPTIAGLRITGGDAAGLGGGREGEDVGGGVDVITATASIHDNWIFGNAAGLGGGLSLRWSGSALSGNSVTSNVAVGGGGLLLVEGASTLTGNTVASNTAIFGGGLLLQSNASTLTGNTVASNAVEQLGGGLLAEGSAATFISNTFSSNSADISGGGLFLTDSDATLDGNTIISNTSDFGGGLQIIESDATLTGNIIRGNAVNDRGGGLYLGTSDGATLSGNTFTSNTAQFGGGIFLRGSAAALDGNVFRGNSAGERGGGLYLRDDSDAELVNNIVADNQAGAGGGGLGIVGSRPILLHTTIARNTGGDGSGVYVDVDSTGDPSSVTLVNNLLVGHTVGIYVVLGNTATLEATLWGSGAWANDTPLRGAGVIVTGTRSYQGAPAFVAPDAGDYHIDSGSAAIDRGVYVGVTTDVDGEIRPKGCFVDIGADEFPIGGECRKTYLPLAVRDF